jgi:Eukaryotic DNA topoisomerase I, catalytic core
MYTTYYCTHMCIDACVHLSLFTLQVVEYNNANREVAILCNHQRTVSGAMMKNFENLQERLDTIKAQRNELKQWKKLVDDGKSKKIPLKGAKKDGDANANDNDEDPDEQVTINTSATYDKLSIQYIIRVMQL